MEFCKEPHHRHKYGFAPYDVDLRPLFSGRYDTELNTQPHTKEELEHLKHSFHAALNRVTGPTVMEEYETVFLPVLRTTDLVPLRLMLAEYMAADWKRQPIYMTLLAMAYDDFLESEIPPAPLKIQELVVHDLGGALVEMAADKDTMTHFYDSCPVSVEQDALIPCGLHSHYIEDCLEKHHSEMGKPRELDFDVMRRISRESTVVDFSDLPAQTPTPKHLLPEYQEAPSASSINQSV